MKIVYVTKNIRYSYTARFPGGGAPAYATVKGVTRVAPVMQLTSIPLSRFWSMKFTATGKSRRKSSKAPTVTQKASHEATIN